MKFKSSTSTDSTDSTDSTVDIIIRDWGRTVEGMHTISVRLVGEYTDDDYSDMINLYIHPNSKKEWRVYARYETSTPGEGLFDECIDFSTLSEEEMFQESLVWSYDLDIYVVRAIQKYILNSDYPRVPSFQVTIPVQY